MIDINHISNTDITLLIYLNFSFVHYYSDVYRNFIWAGFSHAITFIK